MGPRPMSRSSGLEGSGRRPRERRARDADVEHLQRDDSLRRPDLDVRAAALPDQRAADRRGGRDAARRRIALQRADELAVEALAAAEIANANDGSDRGATAARRRRHLDDGKLRFEHRDPLLQLRPLVEQLDKRGVVVEIAVAARLPHELGETPSLLGPKPLELVDAQPMAL